MSMIIAKRFKIIRKIGDFLPDIYEGHNIDKQCNVMLIRIDVPVDKDKSQTAQFLDEPSHDLKLNGIIKPCQIVEDNKSFFAIISLPKGTMLQKNIELMNQLNKPFTETEIIRIGRLLCELTTKAESNNLVPIISSDLIIIAVDGTPSIIAIDPQYISETTATHIKPPQRAIAMLLKEMADAGRKETSIAAGQTDSGISPSLKKILRLASSEDFHFDNVNEFSQVLKQQVTDRRYLKSFIFLCIGILILIAAIVLSRVYSRVEISKQNPAVERVKLATEDFKSKAHKSAKEWAILTSSEHINTPQQAIDAEHLLLRGDESFASMEFEKAQLAYEKAIISYEAAIRLGKETVRIRTDAQKARELTRLSQSRWKPLFGSTYVQLPDQIKRAGDTALEGESQYLGNQYREAVVAYELSTQLYNSVPSKEYKELLYRHQAYAAQERAKIAAHSWEKIKVTVGSKSSVSANRAKEQMAIGKGLLQSGQNAKATNAFNNSATLFETATKSAIEYMAAKVAASNAYEHAVEAAQQWQTLFKAMKKKTEPAEIAEAKESLQNAHQLANQKKYKQSSKNYERAASLYELQIQKLNTEAKTLAKNYANRARHIIKSLSVSQKDLDKRLTTARTQFESIQTRIAQHHESEHHKQLLEDSAVVRKLYRLISKVSSYCNANVYKGKTNKKARSMLTEGQALMTQGEYVSAFIMFEKAADELTSLAELPDAVESFFSMEEQTLSSKKTAMKVIGPVARELSELKKLLDLGNTSISSANELMSTKELTDAARAIEDAKLAFDSLIPQAESELMNYALSADSELRTDVAIAALNELLILNPDHLQARKLMEKIQSSGRPTKRITIVQGKIRNNGKIIPFYPTERALIGIFGKPSRIRASHTGLLFDELGILATPDPETKKIFSIVVYYAKPLYGNEPTNFYPGIIEIEGVQIGRDDSIEKINASLKHIQFKPTQIGNTFKATHMNLRILINYKKKSNQIYSIGMLFLTDLETR